MDTEGKEESGNPSAPSGEQPKEAPASKAAAVHSQPEGVTASVRKKRGKKKRFVPAGRAHILASYNNTIVTIADPNGNVLAWSSAGKVGFKGPKKSTPYAAGIVVRDVLEKLTDVGLKEVDVFVQGVGSGREAAIRALHVNGITINIIKDVTPMPHNGPRPKKVRRV